MQTLLCRSSKLIARAGKESSKASASRKLPLPLHERPAIHATAAQSLETWYKAAKMQTRNAASHFSHPDDPTSEDLQRELNWLVEDAVLEGRRPLLQGSQRDSDLHLRVDLSELQSLWRQRLESRLPLQYLTNSAHWGDLVLAVGPGVLVPRPETRCLIEFAQQACSTNETLAQGSWADLGTGSGALAVGLAKALPSLKQVLAVEKSQQAREWAVMNVDRLQLSSRVQVVAGSWFDPIEHMRGRLAGILSNPPYIESHVLPTLQAEVRMHEPNGALDGGASGGLGCLHAICDSAAEFLIPGGFLGLEMGGPEQAEAVARLPALEKDFVSIERRKDMYGIERFVIALRK